MSCCIGFLSAMWVDGAGERPSTHSAEADSLSPPSLPSPSLFSMIFSSPVHVPTLFSPFSLFSLLLFFLTSSNFFSFFLKLRFRKRLQHGEQDLC